MDAHSGPASSSAGGRQRAALAPLDANVVPSSPRPGFKDAGAPARGRDGAENRVGDGVGTKRPAGADEPADGSPTSKKACFGRDENNLRPQRSRSQSPDASSVFDASWATVATTTTVPDEPDVLNRVLPPAPRLTREQTRQKVEILRLRLGLASYKLRTGQTAVPLADLQHRPLPPRRTVRVQSPPSLPQDASASSSSSSLDSSQDQDSPPQSQDEDAPRTPGHDDDGAGAEPDAPDADPAGSALMRGGAANGLLSLARGHASR